MDGQKPSGFTDQQFWTMDHTSDPSPAAIVKPKDDYKGDSTVENDSVLSDELFYTVYNVEAANIFLLSEGFDAIWEASPIMAIGYLFSNWTAIFAFW